MSLLDRFAYVRELRSQLVRKDLELIEVKADVKRLVDCLATTRGVIAPFASVRGGLPETWGMVNRVSVAREIQELERRHNKGGDE